MFLVHQCENIFLKGVPKQCIKLCSNKSNVELLDTMIGEASQSGEEGITINGYLNNGLQNFTT